jgi:hypothetical protein
MGAQTAQSALEGRPVVAFDAWRLAPILIESFEQPMPGSGLGPSLGES